jgi:FAD/FMN-containing dehydrogenase
MMPNRGERINSWGRLPFASDDTINATIDLSNPTTLGADINNSKKPGLPYGNGRSYGDVCLTNSGPLWRTRTLDHFIAFDTVSGVLRCEAGVTLQEINRLTLPQGWFLPVIPGTQFATLGGAVANDVHGKNHHRRGTLGRHIRQIRLLRTDGSIHDCGPTHETGLFNATIAGLGLTGIMLEIELTLLPVTGEWLEVETIAFDNLDEFFALSADSAENWEYTVSWIDCLTNGRGIFSRGNHASHNEPPKPNRKPLRMFFTPPLSLVNGLSLRVFNPLYFHLNKSRQGRSIQNYKPYFYPLDNILEWNRLYGPKGFYQYQSVVPSAVAADATRAMLKAIADSNMGSPLAVLKTFGDIPSPGLLSFPMEGTTLALDFPNAGAKTLKLFEQLDAIVREAHGRIYPAKDARMPRDLFISGYPKLEEFLSWRDPGIQSSMASRLIPA